MQNSYKEAEIENKLPSQSFRSKKSKGENAGKKWNISIITGVRAIKRIFQKMPYRKMTFFTKAFITQKQFEAGIRSSNTLDKNVISILGINFKLLSVIGAE